MARMQLHWDIFCRVIDNYGDIGVCWRLARQLAHEHGRHVRLWVDDLKSLRHLHSRTVCDQRQQGLEGIEVRLWEEDFPEVDVADVVIEAFACTLPESYLAAMAARASRPVWINLEYLTAETWAESCHGLGSPHPRLPLQKYFFFPGFTAASGGLLRESGLLQARDCLPEKQKSSFEISLFCYDSAPIPDFLTALEAAPGDILCQVPEGQAATVMRRLLSGDAPWHIGQSEIRIIPFATQQEYDRLLWRCDLNFVRGEDSLVRAIWAGRPFIWQAYRQEDSAHLVKLQAFLDRYCASLPDDLCPTLRQAVLGWNQGEGFTAAFLAMINAYPGVATHARKWSDQLAEQPDLASKLITFCARKV